MRTGKEVKVIVFTLDQAIAERKRLWQLQYNAREALDELYIALQKGEGRSYEDTIEMEKRTKTRHMTLAHFQYHCDRFRGEAHDHGPVFKSVNVDILKANFALANPDPTARDTFNAGIDAVIQLAVSDD